MRMKRFDILKIILPTNNSTNFLICYFLLLFSSKIFAIFIRQGDEKTCKLFTYQAAIILDNQVSFEIRPTKLIQLKYLFPSQKTKLRNQKKATEFLPDFPSEVRNLDRMKEQLEKWFSVLVMGPSFNPALFWDWVNNHTNVLNEADPPKSTLARLTRINSSIIRSNYRPRTQKELEARGSRSISLGHSGYDPSESPFNNKGDKKAKSFFLFFIKIIFFFYLFLYKKRKN